TPTPLSFSHFVPPVSSAPSLLCSEFPNPCTTLLLCSYPQAPFPHTPFSHTHKYWFILMHTRINSTHIYTCAHTPFTQIHTHIHTHAHTHTNIHTHTQTQTHAHARTHAHKRAH